MKKTLILAAGLVVCLTIQSQAATKIISYQANSRAGISRSLENMGGHIVKKFKYINAMVVEFPDDRANALDMTALNGVDSISDNKTINWLKAVDNNVDATALPSQADLIKRAKETAVPAVPAPVVVDYNYSGTANPIETLASEIPWGVERVNASGLWNYTQGQAVRVAIIDTGIDYTHPDLKDNYAGGYNVVAKSNDPMDDQGHGTHVAGTIAAVRNGTGVVGVAPRARLYAVKVLGSDGSGSYANIISGIEWAIDNHMNVINMSLGGGGYLQAMHDEIKAARDAGITIVCAAGNDGGDVNYPAKYPETIAVSASDSSDKLAYFSSRGDEITVIAPGVNIYSTMRGGSYGKMSGTSMACPHVAGLAALAIGAGASTPSAVEAKLKAAAEKLPSLSDAQQGAGLVNAAKLR